VKRALALGTLVAAGMLTAAVAAYQQPAAGQKPMVVEADKLKDNLYVLRGGGGNTGVFIMTTGVAVVDTKNPGWGAPLLAKIKEITDKPVTLIINTHTHGDHVSGNVEFPATVDVVAHEFTAGAMKEMKSPPGFKPNPDAVPIFTTHMGHGLPKRTFKDRMTIGKGPDQIDLHYFGRAHTGGDAWVVFPALRMMHAGDAFPGKNIPIMDTNNGGSGVDYPDTLAKAAAAVAKSVDGIITGHSTVMTVQDLSEFADFNREFREAVRAGKKAGQTIDQIAGSWTVPAKFAGYAAPQAARLRLNVEAVYNAIP
jgi:glyoxylase-like metal-dependent hydrolase (beta-lactamase superfamily II)